ncbi:MAG: 3-phosphoglycerate dehydrogenase [Parcubacteria group bacterium CG1_02_39_15]|uniref:3-phosphoglycerate dehydrogenase n=3 Tax=Candidatus Nealsoniibacteriota TaxID=1817911 RepID=A0A2H0MQZ7_9BACT|nr:MAG: 3-phosphoglycerate dehydrogenase [Parcubacteria group bacterium CG1_02_39_15]PIQ98264.1 MAG: 3-phosphoglycerate dehydrogenase [Candidatus Nealsonbacteria bacterium CG11_big_fil_rev_8_21_14_0_20_39_9]PIW90356.1 MAG: 3-phosphoglycerate dehydrogenase [Candidatus Nealsonbacteria bacterium CG_4_8_14_3_um_filter_40_11]PIZ88146.1 MAG: 3-phosphoglycerate dehydrogenase [Candidatus Nealsonbacteria bacterium CG_4_10_14_0_2_um_filter_39_15]
MKILITDPISLEGKEILRREGFEVIEKIGLSKEELKMAIKEVDGIILRSKTKLDKEIIGAANNLKVIGRAGTGLDNIDLEAVRDKKIEVLNTPEAVTVSVAELTLGLIFACARNIKKATLFLKEGKWEKEKLEGVEIYGKTLGIIGLGRIGKEVAKRAISLGMKVIFYDPSIDYFEGVEKVSLDSLFTLSDIITVHVPLTPQTYHLVSRELFSKMKEGTIFINCARGGIIDEEALYEMLSGGKFFAVGLDVFEKEPAIGNKLLELPNVVVTPHLGAQTIEAQKRAGIEIAETIVKFFKADH